MNILEATYRIVTPMFIGDAEQNATDLRPPSIKGALRFWWRALNWGKFLSKYPDSVEALQELHKEESRLFGSADNDSGGQGVFLLQVSQQPKINSDANWPEKANSGSVYMAYGLMESGSLKEGNLQKHRTAIKETNNTFTISLAFKPKTSSTYIENIKETLEVWGLFGGLGSRVRNGFGSVSLVSLNGVKYNLNLNEYCKKIDELLTTYKNINTYPPYTAISQYSQFKIINDSETSTAIESHNIAGNKYKEERLKIDWEDRVSLGLPLNVDDRKNAATTLGNFLKLDKNKNIRRSSPLIFHVHPIEGGKFITGVLYLPAQFHFNYPEPYPHSDVALTNFYQPTTQLLDRI
ncbi:MAG: type III-B CRISPR module RAMP protein Cmr1 [Thiomargarita sp.]|nr:type III-B CRISPR module RAMP protein Cmr1 [Thiomargarita sp.]